MRSRAVILPLECCRSTACGRPGVECLFLARLQLGQPLRHRMVHSWSGYLSR